jgi:ATPase subunit of ABC transporter with duplicated ATPase domains
MPAIHLNNLSFRYSTAVDTLVDVEIHLGPGWTGVVGANGAGKTTLLHLVAGRMTPSVGWLTVDPAEALVILCEQTVDRATPDIERFAESWEGLDASLRGRLDLDVDQLQRWATLSPGERKRWQVGAALSREPDVLLLDEPTNHLDSEARGLLIASLVRFSGVGMVVSHDRSLLEELTTRTLRIDRGEVSLWNGAYGAASEGWTAIESAARAQHERLKAEAKKAERHHIELRQVNESKRARFKRRNNTASFKDIDSRSAARQGKHLEGEKAAGKALATAARASERAAETVSAADTRKTLGGEISFDFEPAPRRLLASHLGPLTVGEATIVEHVDLGVERTDRIWLRGRNGAGKTTLLRSLVDDADLPAEKLLFLEQEMTPEQVAGVSREMENLEPNQRGQVLAIVALLGVDPQVFLASRSPSPGEARKLAMALGIGRAAWLMALDEPTNHLDLPSIERLQRALSSYPGALLVVSHDEEFTRGLGLDPFDLP